MQTLGITRVKDGLVCLKTNLPADEASLFFLQNIPEGRHVQRNGGSKDSAQILFTHQALNMQHKEARFCPKKLTLWGVGWGVGGQRVSLGTSSPSVGDIGTTAAFSF